MAADGEGEENWASWWLLMVQNEAVSSMQQSDTVDKQQILIGISQN